MPLNNKTRWNIIKGQSELCRQFLLWVSLFKLTNVTLFSPQKRKLQQFIFRITLIQIRSREREGGEWEKSQSASQVMQTPIVFVIPFKRKGQGCLVMLARTSLPPSKARALFAEQWAFSPVDSLLSASCRLKNNLQSLATMGAVSSAR